MKRITLVISLVMIIVLAAPQSIAVSASSDYLTSLESFVLYFTLYDSQSNGSHNINDNINDIWDYHDETCIKSIFHGCEIMTIVTDKSTRNIKSIKLTLSSGKNSSAYYTDFAALLMITLASVDVESDSIASYFIEVGSADKLEVGDSHEAVIDGVRVSYVVESYGLIYTIEKA